MSTRLLSQPTAARRVSLVLTGGLLIATFLLTRQTQIKSLAGLGAPWALAMVLLRLRWRVSLLDLLPMLTYASCSMIFSMAMSHEASNAARFFVITMGTLLVFHCRPARISALWAMLPVTFQALSIGAISVGLTLIQDPNIATGVRAAVTGAEWGDVYSFDGFYFRVQLIGNALIPLVFLICLQRWDASRAYRITLCLAMVGLVAAGNLTYVLVAALAVALRLKTWFWRRRWRRIALIAVIPVALVAGWISTRSVFSAKFDGAGSSMAVRFDQVDVAFTELGRAPMALLFGKGLGARFPNGREGDYSQAQYIELQSLYLFLQLGLVGSAIYAVTLVRASRHFIAPAGRTILWLYLLGGTTNPYVLDSNQIVATFMLVMLYPAARTARGRVCDVVDGPRAPLSSGAARPLPESS